MTEATECASSERANLRIRVRQRGDQRLHRAAIVEPCECSDGCDPRLVARARRQRLGQLVDACIGGCVTRGQANRHEERREKSCKPMTSLRDHGSIRPMAHVRVNVF